MSRTIVAFGSYCRNFGDNSAGSFSSQSFLSLQSCWNITFNGNTSDYNTRKQSNTDTEYYKNYLSLTFLDRMSCNRCWMVNLKVSLLVFHGIPSTFVSSTRLGFNDKSVCYGSSKTSTVFTFSCFLMNLINSPKL